MNSNGKPGIRRMAWAGLILSLLMLAFLPSCMKPPREALEHEMGAEDVRRLYRQVVGGQERLLQAMEGSSAEQIVFAATLNGLSIAKDENAPDLVDESRVIFFRPESGQPLYFSPRDLVLCPFAGGGVKALGDACFSGRDGTLVVYRSLPKIGKISRNSVERHLARLEFVFDDKGKIRGETVSDLSPKDAVDLMPLPVPELGTLLFLSRRADGTSLLMQSGLDGANRRPVLASQPFDVRNLRRLSDGHLVVSANPQGYHELLRLSLDASTEAPRSELVPFDGDLPAPAQPAGKILAGQFSNGRFQPELITLPKTWELREILAFCQAHNPGINARRAMLAASMVQIDTARLNNWPKLQWGLFYTPIVGVFLSKPQTTSGDYLSEDAARGLLGFSQPLLDFKRNEALREVYKSQAEFASDVLQEEINQRLTDAAEAYFEADYYRHLVEIDGFHLATVALRMNLYRNLQAAGNATSADILEIEQYEANVRADAMFHQAHLGYCEKKLRELCGLPDDVSFQIADEEFDVETWTRPGNTQLRHLMLENHPRVKASAAVVYTAMFQKVMGPEIRPTAEASAAYAQSRRYFTEALDDYVSLSLSGQVPLATWKAGKFHKEYWNEMLASYKIQREAQTRQLTLLLDEAIHDYDLAADSIGPRRLTTAWRAEALRIAETQRAIDAPNPERRSPDPTLVEKVAQDYLNAMSQECAVRRDVNKYFVRLLGAAGMAGRLDQELQACERRHAWWQRSSLVVANPGDLLSGDAPRDRLLAQIDRWNVKRVYLRMTDASLFEDVVIRGRLSQLLALAYARRTEVWILLDDQSGFDSEAGAARMAGIVSVIKRFNRERMAIAPRLAGVCLRLPAAALADEAVPAGFLRQWFSVLTQVKSVADGDLPVWTECPAWLAQPENRKVREALGGLADGLVLRASSSSTGWLPEQLPSVLAGMPLPSEVAIDISSEAAADADKLSGAECRVRLNSRARALKERTAPSRFAGFVLLDDNALAEWPKED
jgi:outer membrane protein TolC